MIKGTCQKVETLGDGSIKLSVYVNKEDSAQAFPLAFQEVSVNNGASDIPQDAIIAQLKEE